MARQQFAPPEGYTQSPGAAPSRQFGGQPPSGAAPGGPPGGPLARLAMVLAAAQAGKKRPGAAGQ